MKHSYKQKIALLLCAIMLSSSILTSCGGLMGSSDNNPSESTTETNSAPDTEGNTQESTEDGNGSDVSESGDSHTHSYSSTVTPPTCVAKGFTTYFCDECGDSYVVEDEETPSHTPVTDPRVEPTYTSSGLTEGSHCSVCDAILVAQEKIPQLTAKATLTSASLHVDVRTLSGSFPYATETFNFAEDISLTHNATFTVFADLASNQPFEDKTVQLSEGDNVFYLLVTNPDGSTSVYTVNIYRNHLYTVSFNPNGGSEVDAQYVEEGKFATAPVTEREGYTFASWSCDFTSPITSDITVEASWTANENIAYRVEYYLETINKDGYSLAETQNLEGATDTTVYAVKKAFEHFTLNASASVLSGNVDADGSLVLKVFYTRKEYTAAVSLNNTLGGTAMLGDASTDGNTELISDTYAYGEEVTITAETNVGYTFLGWFEGDVKVSDELVYMFTVERSVIYTARWIANEDIAYRVEYYLENVDKDGYNLIEAEIVSREGITDTTAKAEEKIFEHFTLDRENSILSGNVSGDGALVLKVYYTRDTYRISVDANNRLGGTVSILGSENKSDRYAYENEVTIIAETNDGYTFLGWFEGDEKISDDLSYTFAADRSVSYTAKWEANTDVEYTVVYCLENVDKSGYDIADAATEYLVGTADTVAYAELKTFEHFTLDSENSSLSGNISGDGSLVLWVYYTRDIYTVRSEDASICTVNVSQAVAFDKQITAIATINKLGYDFVGWYSEYGELISGNVQYTFNIDCNVVAKFTVAPEIQGFKFTSTYDTCTIDGIIDKSATYISIPYYVTSIGENAFNGCKMLEHVSVSEYGNLNRIGDYAFAGCSSLTEITIPYYVNSIGDHAFYACSALKSITIPYYVTRIGDHAFDGCESLESVTLHSDITSIGNYTFYGCSALESINIPSSVTSIGDHAFEGCEMLESVSLDIYGSLESIGDYAFYACSALKSISIPYNVISIGDYTFSGCSSLEHVVIIEYAPLNSIGDYAFYGCTALKDITISNAIESIGIYAFYGCKNLASNLFNSYCNLHSIGDYAFYGCESLGSLAIPQTLESIGKYAFYGCKKLESVTSVENGQLYSIGEYAFYGCSALESVTIPKYVKNVGYGAFSGCSSLESITLPFVGASVKTSSDTYQYPLGYIFGSDSYAGGVATIQHYYGSSKTSTAYSTYYIPAALRSVTVTGGNILTGAFYGCEKLTKIIIPTNTESIGDRAFYGCSSLTEITIPTSVGSIGYGAFSGCAALTSLTVPVTVTSIGYGAFSGCSSLESITLPFIGASDKTASNTYQYPLGYIFGSESYVGGVATIQHYYGASLTETTASTYYIPEGLKSVTVTNGNILYGAFLGCSGIEAVNIGKNVTNISAGAFYACSSLKQISVDSSNHSYLSTDGNLYDRNGATLIQYAVGKTDASFAVPYGVTAIAKLAFASCDKLTSVTIPNSVTDVQRDSFADCPNLIEKENGVSYIDNWALDFDDSASSVTLRFGTRGIAESAFAGADLLKEITVPNSVTNIGFGAFSGCSALESISIPFVGAAEGGESNSHFGYIFGAQSFEDNENYVPLFLKSVIITGSASIGENAFKDCKNIKSVTIPASITGIGHGAFYGCERLSKVIISDLEAWCNIWFGDYYSNPLIYAKELYFDDAPVTDLVIPNGVTYVRSYAFYGYRALESVTIPSTVESIGYSAFSGCLNLESVTISEGLRYVEQYAFRNCISLIGIDIPYGTERIGFCAFESCINLKDISIPESVTSIGQHAFKDCSFLIQAEDGVLYVGKWAVDYDDTLVADVCFRDGTVGIANGTFSSCSELVSITIPESLIHINENPFSQCSALESITVDENNTVYHSADNCLIETASGTLIVGCKNSIIPDNGSVQAIGSYAFESCYALESITIPYSVTSIGNYAFTNCSNLKNVTIPDSVTVIGDGAFSYCYNLSSIYIPESVTYIGQNAFDGCSAIETQDGVSYVDRWVVDCDTSVTYVELRSDTVGIANYAFSECYSLTDITIPISVTVICDWAFYDCHELTSIYYYDGWTYDWYAINKTDGYWDYNTGNYSVYCYDGTISK